MTDSEHSISSRRRPAPHHASADAMGAHPAPTHATLRHRAATLVVAAAIAWSVSACGVTIQDEPEPLDSSATTSAPTPTVTVVPDVVTGATPTSAAPPTTTNEG